jgi:hypothetical protein
MEFKSFIVPIDGAKKFNNEKSLIYSEDFMMLYGFSNPLKKTYH